MGTIVKYMCVREKEKGQAAFLTEEYSMHSSAQLKKQSWGNISCRGKEEQIEKKPLTNQQHRRARNKR